MENFIKHFKRLPDGSWECISSAELSTSAGRIQVTEGARFTPGTVFMNFDVVKSLEEQARKMQPL
jgi:hypothetical protein